MNSKSVTTTLAAVSAALATGVASASGFQLLEQNASGIGNAYAGSAAVADDASTVFFNPAGMTHLKPLEVSLGADLISPSYKFSNSASANTPAPLGSNGGNAGSAAVVPAGYMSWGISPDFFVGLGVSVPFGLKTDYNDDWAGRFQSTLFDIKTVNINPSVAWRVNDWFSIGAGLDWMHMKAKYQRYAAVVNATTQGTKITLDASDEAFGWNAGVLFKASPTTDVGLSYRSKIKQKLTGDISSTQQVVLPNGDASTTITLPDTFILSVKQQLTDKWQLLGDVSRTGWSSINDVVIARAGTPVQTLDAAFDDTWRVALGANYLLNSKWTLKGGVAYDQTPVKNSTTRLAAMPDNDRVWLSLGTRYQLTPNSRIDVGASYLVIGDTDIANNQAAAGRGNLVGTYKADILIFGAQYTLAL
ncbi:MAG: outer membrane protein transport protein [Pseudomonadota bacterium]